MAGQPGSPVQFPGVPSTTGLPTVRGFGLGPTIMSPPSSGGWQSIAANVAVAVGLAVATQATTFSVPPPLSNTITGTGWYQQLSSSATVAVKAQHTQATTFSAPAPASNTVKNLAWQQPLSVAVPVAKTVQAQSFVPFNTTQSVTQPSGWQTIQSSAPRVAVINGSGLTFVVAPFVVPPSGWSTQPSVAAPVAQAQQGFAAVPFNTAQVATTPPNGWFGPASNASKTTVAQATQPTTFATPQVVTLTPGQFGWYQPLSKSAPVAVVQQGNTSVPFNTAQVQAPSVVPLIQDTSATTATNVYYQSLFSPLRPIAFVPPPPPPNGGWFEPLSPAPNLALAQPTQVTTFSVPPQVQPAGIAGMAWFTPLGTVATSLRTAPQGMSFVPFDTVQVTPPPPPPSTEPEWKPFLVSMGKLMGMG